MLRTALKPRWLGLLALVIVVMVTFGLLGLWQLDVARDKGRAEAVKAAPLRPTALAVDRDPTRTPTSPSTARTAGSPRPAGTTRPARSWSRPGCLQGRQGYWVVTPLVVTRHRCPARGRARVRHRPARATPPATTGTVTVSGTLAPGESPTHRRPALPAGQTGLGGPVGAGQPVARRDLQRVRLRHRRVAGGHPHRRARRSSGSRRRGCRRGLSWRNAAYALQWWIFALFAAYMWWRMVRDDHEGRSGTVDNLRDDLHERATHV